MPSFYLRRAKLLLEQTVEVRWNPMNKKHYESLGYTYSGKGNVFKVKAIDLPLNSEVVIKVKCDYCGTEITQKYQNYNAHRKVIKKDACSKCRTLKVKDSILAKYGVSNISSVKEIHEKVIVQKRHSMEFIKQQFSDAGYKIIEGQEYTNSFQKLKYICPKHGEQEITYASFQSGKRCRECYLENVGGSNHYNWQGGITNINNYLREQVNSWRYDTIKSQEGKCVITGKDADIVHHIYGFSLITKEVFKLTNMHIYDTVSQYTPYELELLSTKCLQLHYKYGLGACLTKDMHFLFHEKYGYGDNTPEQFNEFLFSLKE